MRVLVLMSPGYKSYSKLRTSLNAYDAKNDVRLYLLSDQSPADKLPLQWCRDLGAPRQIFKAKTRAPSASWELAVRKRDLAIFEIGQPDIVLLFHAKGSQVSVRRDRVIAMAKERGIPVRRLVLKYSGNSEVTYAESE